MISLICFLLSPEMEMIGKIDVWLIVDTGRQ